MRLAGRVAFLLGSRVAQAHSDRKRRTAAAREGAVQPPDYAGWAKGVCVGILGTAARSIHAQATQRDKVRIAQTAHQG